MQPFKQVDFDPFAEVEPKILVPTTESQREIWTSVKLGGDPANCAYNESVSILLQGHLDYLSLINAVNSTMDRHDALRSTFSKDGTFMQVNNKLSLELPLIDFSASREKEEEVKKWLLRDVETPFSLENGPLIRVHVLKLSQTNQMIVITAHHIICDGWSISLIMLDIAAFYNASIAGVPLEKAPATQFSKYALDEMKKLKGNEHRSDEEYWLQLFKGFSETLELPIDKPRPPVRTFSAKRIDVEFDKSVVDKVKQIGAKAGCSLVNTLTVAFEVFLYRITGSEDVVVGIPAAGQSVTDQNDLVGHCVNLLPLKSHIGNDISFINHLKNRKKEILDCFDHQQYTFGSLVNKLTLPRDPGRIPLVPVIFNVDAGVFDGIRFNGLECSFSSNPRSFENFEIFINAANYNGKFIVECTFNTDLFDEDVMNLRMKEFYQLLNSIAENPDEYVDKLNILEPVERELLLHGLHNTSISFPNDKSISNLVEEQVLLHLNEVAVVDGKQSLTYEALNARVNILANHLLENGASADTIIAVCVERGVDLIVALLAVLKTGASYLPIDPAFPTDRIQYMVDDASVHLLITQTEYLEKIELPSDKVFLLEGDWLEHTTKKAANPKVTIRADHRAYLIYTSGSTGKPKGVQVSHQSVVNLLLHFQRELQVTPKDNLLGVTTVSFDIAGLELFLPLVSGCRLTLASKEDAIDPNRLLAYIQNQQITILQATPVSWRMLLAAGWNGKSNLKILCGGEALNADLAQQLCERSDYVWNVYGPTETTIWSSSYRLIKNEKAIKAYASIGKPIANTRFYVLDSKLQPVPMGVIGELFIGGDGVSLGYLNRPDLNTERFISNPFDSTEKKLYKTGDLVRYHLNGNLDYINRIDNQVKVRGYRIELGEIEVVLSQHPTIKSNVVISRKDRSGENRLIAYYIVQTEKSVSPDKLKAHLQEKLPDYMVPSIMMEVKKFPLTPNGKIDRKALPEPEHLEPVTRQFISSRTPNENLLASIWTEILGVSDISMNDDFFKLGGHSLLAVELMMEIEKHRGLKLPLAILFTNSTIEKLARVMDAEVSNQVWHSIVPIKMNGNRNPLFFGHGVSGNVFKYHALSGLLPDDQPCYGLQAYGLNGKDIPFDSIEKMAAYHVKEILNFQPENKSFSLAGGSFGGYLVFEMARQLEAMGKKVELVALIDIDAATAIQFLPFYKKHLVNTGILFKRIYNRIVHILSADKAEREKYLSHKFKSLKTKKELDIWLNKEDVAKTAGEEQASYFNNIEDACYKALMSYRIKPYDGKVILFRAKSGYFSAKYDFDLGWNYYAKSGVEIYEVPGDHNSIFNKGNVEEMARIFTECLNRIQSK